MRDKIKENQAITYIYDKVREVKLRYFTNKKKMIEKKFYKEVGRELNMSNPIYFNDKLQWLKFNYYNSLASKCADKYEVRRYVEKIIGKEYLNDLIGVYNYFGEINTNKLPKQFALKVTHSSGYNLIVENRDAVDWKKERKNINRWLRRNYYYSNMEWVYRDIKPRIIIEKYLGSNVNDELQDYRFFCFNGKPEFISVDFSITDASKTRRNIYDLNWNRMDVQIQYPFENDIIIEKPPHLEKMIELSSKLSAGFPHVRVDFYYINNKIIFGELTFFHRSGMAPITPIEYEEYLGNLIDLTVLK